MADYRTDGFASYYAGTGPVGNYVGTSPGFLSLWDVELDTTFEFGDPINGTETYAGSIEVADPMFDLHKSQAFLEEIGGTNVTVVEE